MLKGFETIVVMVSFHSYSWVRQCIRNFCIYCKGTPLLVLDNNPSKDDKQRLLSFRKSWIEIKVKDLDESEEERQWLSLQPNIILARTPKFFFHGEALNYALSWCKDRHIKYMVHIEPDCIINGDRWLKSLKSAIKENVWMASGEKLSFGVLHPTPSIWCVKNAIQFNFIHKGKLLEPLPSDYHLYIDENKMSETDFNKAYWDMGHYAWFECERMGKAKHVVVKDICHCWSGTKTGNDKYRHSQVLVV